MTELIWNGKYRDGKRVAPMRIELPFQTVEAVDESSKDGRRALGPLTPGRPTEWRNRLIWGDKQYILPSLLREFSGRIDLIYIDPPFVTGADFSITTKIPKPGRRRAGEPSILAQKAYRDTWSVSGEERSQGVQPLDRYFKWFYETVALLGDLLADDGSIYVHLDWHVAHYAKAIMDEVFGYGSFRAEIVWRYRRWPAKTKNYQRMHDTILYYTKNPSREPTFNVQYEPIAASTRKTFGTKKQQADFSSGHRKPSQVDEDTLGAPLSDVWDIGVIAPIGHERVGYPTQKPEALLERIIAISTDKDDLVLDCFCGSGTTATVAERLGRRWIACDLGRFAIHTTRKRLLDTQGVRPFVIQNLGKHERRAWMAVEFDRPGKRIAADVAYRRFILGLYNAVALDGSAWIHGTKGRRLVHVGPVDAPVTLADLRTIVAEAQQAQAPRVDVLGWDFAFELKEAARQAAANTAVEIKFRRIPREVLDKRAAEQGDVQPRDFFELRALSTRVTKAKRAVTVTLTDFVLPTEDLPDDVVGAVLVLRPEP